MPVAGDELHHVGWNACSSCHGKPGVNTHKYLVVNGFASGNIYFVDVKTDPRAPALFKTLTAEEIGAKTGLGLPHTSHCAPTEIIVSCLGSPKTAEGPGSASGNGYLSIDPVTLEINGRWEAKDSRQDFGYDFWYQPRHNVMVSSEFGEPAAFSAGFNPANVAEGKYGKKLYVWDFAEKKIIQELDLGVGSIPLEVRFLHDPDRTEGFVGCALSSTMVRFFKNAQGQWETHEAVKVDPVDVTGWALPFLPGLITDFVISLDDKFLYLSNWLQGDVRQYDISEPARPRLVGRVFIGGSAVAGGTVTVTTPGFTQPEPLVVKGVRVQGGPQMIQLSLDGKRLYVSTSLLTSWDKQFYPELVRRGAQLLQIDVNNVSGGLAVNPNFLVDFGAEPYGPALCHEMRFPGGDCTSDIWL
jgi:selenium-binding protein 1